MKTRLIFSVLLFLGTLNAVCFGLLNWLNPSEPQQELFLRTQKDGLIVFGKNHLGMFRFRSFQNWSELNKYLANKQLELLPLNDVPPRQNLSVKTSNDKIRWNTINSEKVLHAPDRKTAEEFSLYARYNGLQHSILGFAIPLQAIVLAR